MSNYYFNLDGAPSKAVLFDDLVQARDEAVRYLAQVVSEAPHSFWHEAMIAMTVTDESGKILFTLRLVGTIAPGAS